MSIQYLTGCHNRHTVEGVAGVMEGRLGLLLQPGNGYRSQIPNYEFWAADNGCFTSKAGWSEEGWWSWLEKLPSGALFATAPDVVGNAAATQVRSGPWLERIRGLGIPVAFVAQDGLEDLECLWDDDWWASFDVLFVGGSTNWKLGEPAAAIVALALSRGQRVHMGRVNSRKRLLYADGIGCDTADGTYVGFGPDQNFPKLRDWLWEAEPFTWGPFTEPELRHKLAAYFAQTKRPAA